MNRGFTETLTTSMVVNGRKYFLKKVIFLNKNWVLNFTGTPPCFYGEDFDDYGHGVEHPISIGDEISAECRDDPQYGIVVGIIRNIHDEPVCYKVVRIEDSGDTVGVFDYIQARDVTFYEPCGSSEWSLGRIGYTLVENEDNNEGIWQYKFYNETTKDVIFW